MSEKVIKRHVTRREPIQQTDQTPLYIINQNQTTYRDILSNKTNTYDEPNKIPQFN